MMIASLDYQARLYYNARKAETFASAIRLVDMYLDRVFFNGMSQRVSVYLRGNGIVDPTDIQRQAIPVILDGKDMVGLAETGSGKTLAYLLPILAKINHTLKVPQAVIMTPTRELALQVYRVAQALCAADSSGVSACLLIGSVGLSRQIEALKAKPHLIVGSPGRILELNKMRKLTMHHVKTIVIDEADRLLDADNCANVSAVVKTTQKDRQLLFFSATMDAAALNAANTMAKTPVVVKSGARPAIPSSITHMVFCCDQRKKIEMLRKIVHGAHIRKALVFLNNADALEIAVKRLNYHQLPTVALFGGASKRERQTAMDNFRKGRALLLAASDLAARGLHIDGLTHVVNLDVPENPAFYLHRAGRVGRMAQAGVTITLATPREMPFIKNIEKKYGIAISHKDMRYGHIVDVL